VEVGREWGGGDRHTRRDLGVYCTLGFEFRSSVGILMLGSLPTNHPPSFAR
jgi:hypothetical protein